LRYKITNESVETGGGFFLILQGQAFSARYFFCKNFLAKKIMVKLCKLYREAFSQPPGFLFP
jgi:hypothetical protein